MGNRYVLFIDSSDSQKTIVRLEKGTKIIGEKVEPRKNSSQAVLPLLQQLLQEQKVSFSDFTAIRVNPGPGSFTGLRVGAAVAQTLGWILNIPVNGKQNHPIELRYENSRW